MKEINNYLVHLHVQILYKTGEIGMIALSPLQFNRCFDHVISFSYAEERILI